MRPRSSLPVLSCQQVRDVDRMAIEDLKMPGLVLMENAGRGVADAIHARFGRSRTLIACGPGNNGGDGFVIARHLDARGWHVRVLPLTSPERLRGDALANFQWLAASSVTLMSPFEDGHSEMTEVFEASVDCVIDAVLGTGAHGPLRPPVAALCRALNHAPGTRLAVDIPTGLNAESGQADDDTFLAHTTYTFVAAKPGLCRADAKKYVGDLEILPIGVPDAVLKRFGISQHSADR